ncbi:MAG: hypothetical protein NDI62_03515 [Burkholderiales bacterium]|nr:hypothetical protein [Burkholderiales bacterium]
MKRTFPSSFRKNVVSAPSGSVVQKTTEVKELTAEAKKILDGSNKIRPTTHPKYSHI